MRKDWKIAIENSDFGSEDLKGLLCFAEMDPNFVSQSIMSNFADKTFSIVDDLYTSDLFLGEVTVDIVVGKSEEGGIFPYTYDFLFLSEQQDFGALINFLSHLTQKFPLIADNFFKRNQVSDVLLYRESAFEVILGQSEEGLFDKLELTGVNYLT